MRTFQAVWKPTRGCVCITSFLTQVYFAPKYVKMGSKLGKNSFWNTDRGLIWVAGNSWMYRVPETQGRPIGNLYLVKSGFGTVQYKDDFPSDLKPLVLERISRVEYLFGD
jgi:hypothetical protein